MGVELPVTRPRRLRQNAAVRAMVAETRLHPRDFVLPVFVKEGATAPAPISSMPGVVQHTLDSLVDEARACVAAGVGGFMIFGVPTTKDAVGSGGDDPDGILNVAVARVREAVGDDLVVMADLCLDEFTDHGHCGVLDEHGRVDNDATLERYASMAVAQARAGAHAVGPSGMMDGQVRVVRSALDEAGFIDTIVFAYSAKYASGVLRAVPRGRRVLPGRRPGDLPAGPGERRRRAARDPARPRRGRRHRHGQARPAEPRRRAGGAPRSPPCPSRRTRSAGSTR